MADPFVKKLARAQKAYQKGDKHKGAQLVNEILEKDFTHAGAWQLLYQKYGGGREFQVFQWEFCADYYPDRIHLLKSVKYADKEGKTSRQSVLARLRSALGRLFNRKDQVDKPMLSGEDAVLPMQLFEPGSLLPDEKSNGKGPQAEFHEPVKSRDSLLKTATQNASKGQSVAIPASTNTPIDRPLPPRPRPGGNSLKIRVLVVDDIAETRENIIRSLRFSENVEVLGGAINAKEGIRMAIELDPDVVLMDVNMPDMDGITATGRLHAALPHVQVIILTVQDDVDYMRQAMRAGARDFLTKPPMIDELLSAVQKAAEISRQERAKAQVKETAQTIEGKPRAQGRVITIYSPKGGAGCTMLAANLAAALRNDETPVALVDAKPGFGDITILFNEQSRTSLADLTRHAGELDKDLVAEVMVSHPSGIDILAGARADETESITAEGISQVLQYLTHLYSYVVVDVSHELNDKTIAVFDNSDLVVVIAKQDIPTLAAVRKFLDLAHLLNLPKENILVVLNQFDTRINITVEKIEQSFQRPLAATLPYEPAVVIPSINRGSPFMLGNEKVTRAIGRAMLEVSEAVRKRFAQEELVETEEAAKAVRR